MPDKTAKEAINDANGLATDGFNLPEPYPILSTPPVQVSSASTPPAQTSNSAIHNPSVTKIATVSSSAAQTQTVTGGDLDPVPTISKTKATRSSPPHGSPNTLNIPDSMNGDPVAYSSKDDSGVEGFMSCPTQYTPTSAQVLPEDGCAYFFDGYPNSDDTGGSAWPINAVKICSCAPFGTIGLEATTMFKLGLLQRRRDGSFHSMLSNIVTGPDVSVTVYTDDNMSEDQQLSLGPLTFHTLYNKSLELETGALNGTWTHAVFSMMLDSWSVCKVGLAPGAESCAIAVAAPAVPTLSPSLVPGETLTPTVSTPIGYTCCPYEMVFGNSLLIPAQPGCAYFLPAVPSYGVEMFIVKLCSCSPFGVLSFDTNALIGLGLVQNSESMISYIVTGPEISLSLYSDSTFHNDRQLTIGPSSQFVLRDYERLEAIKGGELGPGRRTWDRDVYSFVLNSWSLCSNNAGGHCGQCGASSTPYPVVTEAPLAMPTSMPVEPTFAPTVPPTGPSPVPTFMQTTSEPSVSPAPTIPEPSMMPTFSPTFGPDVHICQDTLDKPEGMLDITIQPGCAVFIMKDGIDTDLSLRAPMTTVCTCDLVGTIFLENTDMQKYGLLGDHLKGEISYIITGTNVTVTMYEGSDFAVTSKKYVIGPSLKLDLRKLYMDADQVPGADTTMIPEAVTSVRRLRTKNYVSDKSSKSQSKSSGYRKTKLEKEKKEEIVMRTDDKGGQDDDGDHKTDHKLTPGGKSWDDDFSGGDTARNSWSDRVQSLTVMSWLPCSGKKDGQSICLKTVTQSPVARPSHVPKLR